MSFLRKKSFDAVMEHTRNGGLKRSLGAFDLFLMGIGAIIGSGIFVFTGVTAAEMSGPAVSISYLIAGLSAVFVALAYTEVASMIPTSGGVYAYSYVSLGEVTAWIVGWMTSLYLMISAATVASGWSGYVKSILQDTKMALPTALTNIPSDGGIINLPAVFISLLVTFMLIRGTKESAKINSILVFVKISAIILFIIIALPHFNIDNWFKHYFDFDSTKFGSSDFIPFGYEGVISGAALVFFGYNGFDTLANATEEAKNPERDITIAILSALIVCMLLYMIVAGILVGIVPFNELCVPSPLAYALNYVGNNKGAAIVAAGAIAGMSTVVLLQMYAQSRMLYVMARDGLLPKSFTKIHDKSQTPYVATIIVGIMVSIIAGLCPLTVLGSLASMGALFSYSMVAIIMLVLRKTMPDVKRPFKCPLAYITAPIALFSCSYLIYTLLMKVGIYFIGWLLIGLVIYIVYAYNNSNLKSEVLS